MDANFIFMLYFGTSTLNIWPLGNVTNLVIWLLSKVAQMHVEFWAKVKSSTFHIKLLRLLYGATFGKIWASFYSNLSHCQGWSSFDQAMKCEALCTFTNTKKIRFRFCPEVTILKDAFQRFSAHCLLTFYLSFSLSLPLSHTHTHAHIHTPRVTHNVSFSLSLSLFLCPGSSFKWRVIFVSSSRTDQQRKNSSLISFGPFPLSLSLFSLPISSSVWTDLAKVCQCGEILHVFGNLKWVNIVFGQNFEPTMSICFAAGQIFFVANGKILCKWYNHLVTLLFVLLFIGHLVTSNRDWVHV